MSAGKICTREVHLADENEPIVEAARRMAEHDVGTLVIVDQHEVPVGIVTDRDIVVRVTAKNRDPLKVKVFEVMTKNPIKIWEDTPIEDAIAMMKQQGCRRLPVVDARDRLVGVIALDDVLNLIGEEMALIQGLLAS